MKLRNATIMRTLIVVCVLALVACSPNRAVVCTVDGRAFTVNVTEGWGPSTSEGVYQTISDGRRTPTADAACVKMKGGA